MSDTDLNRLKIDKQTGSTRRRKRLSLPVLLAAAILLLCGAVFATWHWRSVPVVTASVSQVYPAQTFTLLNASGYLVAQRKAAVATKITGRLEWLGVAEGDRVSAGTVLARLDNREAAAILAQARAGVASAEAARGEAVAEADDALRSYRRLAELRNGNFISQAELDLADARRERAAAALAAADASIGAARANQQAAEVAYDNTFIRAPFDAVVLTKNADIGDIVTPLGAAANAKAAVVSIADLGSLQVEADVSEANLGKIRVGQPCEVQLDAIPEKRFAAELLTIVPTADRSKATVLVKVRLLEQDPRLLPEMSARVAFLDRPVATTETEARTALPPAAVINRDGRTFVFRLRGKYIEEIPVRLGAPLGDMVEVLDGVRAGDKIALSPLERLRDGRRVTLAEP